MRFNHLCFVADVRNVSVRVGPPKVENRNRNLAKKESGRKREKRNEQGSSFFS